MDTCKRHLLCFFTCASSAVHQSCCRPSYRPACQPHETMPHQTGCPLSCGSAALAVRLKGRTGAHSRHCSRLPGTCPQGKSTCSKETRLPSQAMTPPCVGGHHNKGGRRTT